MLLEIRQIGNSAGITIPKQLLKMLHLVIGDKLEAKNVKNGILLEPVKEHKKYNIKDLLLLCNEENMALTTEDKNWLSMPSTGLEKLNE